MAKTMQSHRFSELTIRRIGDLVSWLPAESGTRAIEEAVAIVHTQTERNRKMSMREILENIFDNGRVTPDSSQNELEEQFDFEATENGWSIKEIKEAIKSQWFPSL